MVTARPGWSDVRVEMMWAKADSLLGLIQRGRGACYEAALASRAEAAEFVVECIVDDPRWDHQVENRGWLYARLVADLGVDLRRLRDAYSKPVDTTGDSDAWLVVEVLENLARAGVNGSVSELRRYLRTGRDAELAINALADFHDHPEAQGLLEEVLAVADDTQLNWALAWTGDLPEPWARWRAQSPRIERLLAAREQERQVSGSGLSLSAARRARATAERELIMNAAGVADTGWEPTLLAIAPALLADVSTPLRVRVAVRRQLKQLRSPRALAWARANAGMDGDLAYQALSLLCEIGDFGDAEMFLDYVKATGIESNDTIYAQCTLVSGLTRLAFASAVPMFETLFETTVYSYLRERCALGLSALAPDFAHERAFECLTDAESGIRAIGIAHVDLSIPRVRERLTRIAADAMEDDANRRAAAVRKI
ncbi:hypothetical protein [Nocardia sp. NPDC004722]